MDSKAYFILTLVFNSLLLLLFYAKTGGSKYLLYVLMAIYMLFGVPLYFGDNANKIISILYLVPVFVAYLGPMYWKAIKNKDD